MILKFHGYELEGTSEELSDFIKGYETKIEIIKGNVDYKIGDTITLNKNLIDDLPRFAKGGYVKTDDTTLV